MVEMLLKHGADVNKASGLHSNMTSLHLANDDRCYVQARQCGKQIKWLEKYYRAKHSIHICIIMFKQVEEV